MEQNHIHSPEAATDEPAFSATPVLSAAGGPRLSIPEQLVSPALNRTFADPAARSAEAGFRARRCRHDGWTPERQVAFLEALAACGVVMDACKQVGLSAQSAYAFRNRRAGRAFATAWDAVLVHRARGRLSDELLSRAMNGCIEAVHRDGEIVGERHRFDNRLSMAVLTRLDRLAERQGDREDQLRAVAEDLDDFLDCVEQGGDADAFVEARRPGPEPEPQPGPAPAPRIEDDIDRLAALAGCLDYKDMDPACIDISDLPAQSESSDLDQYLRGHYSGYWTWLEIKAAARRADEGEGELQAGDPGEDLSPEAYMCKLRASRRRHLEAAADRGRGEAPAMPVEAELGSAPDVARHPSTSSTYPRPSAMPMVEAPAKPDDMQGE